MVNAISIKNLYKTYKEKKAPEVNALKGINLEIKEGSFFGLLGPNGAGKSTLINLITGICNLTSGEILVFGKDIIKDFQYTRKMIGLSQQEFKLDPFLFVKEELRITGGFFGKDSKYLKEKIPKLLQRLGLSEKANAYTDRISGGMKRRVSVAKALIHEPKILILDEPTAGLDVELRQELWTLLEELNKSGTTILLTTHYLEEAEHLCDTIAIINDGQIKHIGENIKNNTRATSNIEKLYREHTHVNKSN
jgi:ABC-2 type transport system ATP-binding protein